MTTLPGVRSIQLRPPDNAAQWPPCVADAELYFCPVSFFFLSCFIFLVQYQRSQTGCLPCLHTMVWP